MTDDKELSSFVTKRDTSVGRGLLFVISGSSGVGKGTLREKVFNIFPDLEYSVSVNTRPGQCSLFLNLLISLKNNR